MVIGPAWAARDTLNVDTRAREQPPRSEMWPEWKYDPASRSLPDQVRGLWASGGLVAFVVFCGLLCLEWYLRRRWGMV